MWSLAMELYAGYGFSLQVHTLTADDLWLVNISSGDGLVPEGNKPLTEPILTTQFIAAIWYHKTTVSWFALILIKIQ